jgi:hypothetical protein
MVWMALAVVLFVVLFTVNILVAREVTEAGFNPLNVGYAYGVFGGWFTTPVAGFALYLAGAPTWLAITASILVMLVPYFLGQMSVVKERIDATTALLKSRRPQRG